MNPMQRAVARRYDHAEDGFTLIEMLIVILIMGVLAAIVVLGIGAFQGTGDDQARADEPRQLSDRYDVIGQSYGTRRRPDPRIAARIHTLLGDAETVIDVGAGVGSYEPDDRRVVAVEPSAVMLAQRPAGA